jgi:hypothetical protein
MRLPKIMIHWNPEGREKRGRPRRTWKDGINTAMNGRDRAYVGPCHHGMARPQVADRGTASYMKGSSESEGGAQAEGV